MCIGVLSLLDCRGNEFAPSLHCSLWVVGSALCTPDKWEMPFNPFSLSFTPPYGPARTSWCWLHNISPLEFFWMFYFFFFGLDVEVMQSWKDFGGGLALNPSITVHISCCKSFTLERGSLNTVDHFTAGDIMETLRHGDELQSHWCASSGGSCFFVFLFFFPSGVFEGFVKHWVLRCGSVYSKIHCVKKQKIAQENSAACVGILEMIQYSGFYINELM